MYWKTLKDWTLAFFTNKDLGIHWYLSAQGTLFHSVAWEKKKKNFDTNLNKILTLYFYDVRKQLFKI